MGRMTEAGADPGCACACPDVFSPLVKGGVQVMMGAYDASQRLRKRVGL